MQASVRHRSFMAHYAHVFRYKAAQLLQSRYKITFESGVHKDHITFLIKKINVIILIFCYTNYWF
jgi:hypothetical protein